MKAKLPEREILIQALVEFFRGCEQGDRVSYVELEQAGFTMKAPQDRRTLKTAARRLDVVLKFLPGSGVVLDSPENADDFLESDRKRAQRANNRALRKGRLLLSKHDAKMSPHDKKNMCATVAMLGGIATAQRARSSDRTVVLREKPPAPMLPKA
jgi:hypothetical protein